MTRRTHLFRASAVSLALLCIVCSIPAHAEDPVKRILIVGDSWAASVATQAVDAKGFGSFDAVLKANGFGRFATQGAKTAWGGRKASDWAKPENLAKITEELRAYPTIDIVHLIVGGNDFLALATKGKNIMSFTPQERAAFWDAIEKDVQKIVDHCLAQRPNVRVLISEYDYLDAAKAQAAPYGFDFGGASARDLNDAFVELGRRKLEIARRTPRCAYVSNWGALQRQFDYPRAGLPDPGGPPNYTPYAGGDPNAPLPPAAHVGDGVHPTDEAHRCLLQRCMDQFYKQWLSEAISANGTSTR